MMTDRFQDVVETDDVGSDVDIRMIDGITDAGLGSQIDDQIERMRLKQFLDESLVGNIAPDEFEILVQILNLFQTIFLQRNIIVIVHVVDTDDLYIRILQQPHGQIGTDETADTGKQYFLIL